MNLNEVYTKIKELYESFQTAHNGTTKKSAKEARLALMEIKKLVTLYRKASVQNGKAK